jgi:hypothetical protein
VIAGKVMAEFRNEQRCIAVVLLAWSSIKEGQSDRMTYWKFLNYRRVVRKLENND